MLEAGIAAYASSLQLSANDRHALRVHDAYSLHRVVYGLFDNIRTPEQKISGASSGFLFANRGVYQGVQRVIIISNRKPHQTPQFGTVATKPVPFSFLEYATYRFEATLNPVIKTQGKHISIKGVTAIEAWLASRAPTWGFTLDTASLQITMDAAQHIKKEGKTIVHNSITVTGILRVTDRLLFQKSFTAGIGRGKAFGFGLLQVSPQPTN